MATRRGATLRLEARKFRKFSGNAEDPSTRPLRILDFQLPQETLCTRDEEERWRRRWNLARTLRLPPRWFKFHAEKSLAYDPAFPDLPDGLCLHGYFQSELYFAPVEAQVRRAFRPRDEALASVVEAGLAALREQGRALVALHIRRGDFLTQTDRDCLTSDAFVEAAMSRFPGCRFLVFSDDLDWCRARFAGRGDVTFSPFTRVIEDFVAMSRCDHIILAKSTFSWWAAWLNEQPGRTVVAPKIAPQSTWGGGGPDYYPRGWTIL